MRLEGILMVKAAQGKAYRFRGAGATMSSTLTWDKNESQVGK